MNCKECDGLLKPKEDLFKLGGEEKYNQTVKEYEKVMGIKFEGLKGFNCIKCGACYDEQYKRERINLAWL